MPSSKDIPEDFRVAFNDSKRNTFAGILGKLLYKFTDFTL